MTWLQGTVRTRARVPPAVVAHADTTATARAAITTARLTFGPYAQGGFEVPYSRHDAVAARGARSRGARLRRLGRGELAAGAGVEARGSAPGAAERGRRRDRGERARRRRGGPGDREQPPAGRHPLAGAQPLAPAARPPRRGQP